MAFVWPVRVYWEDTDAGGVVYYANYLKFLERARSEWLRSLGFEQDVLREREGVVFVVRRVEIDYLSPARFNDALEISVEPGATGRVSLEVVQTIGRGPTRLAQAQVKLACVEAVSFKPARIPASILQATGAAT
ncbi:MAG: tol-pal system-associated acyl-CoA thioesterase [Hydrogenophilales bacterium 16-64-46]|nr:MAG: tol-pal system-associated acyl-CoA thioesterase [Hydrogenophilales bacterium 12-64-13]OYZ04421.1 MAG: tol-pal system-associated acyl-CoA thioesterase [Hydrogenophilales bacterium 16-64-46]OZA38215.1 MAG: tol-pal system-associated acyl-CoA thioesterase [Hydrogenophilales bacterium 17-64-34]HQS99117.1 tol-pal system-associated acyl-CoA thioesterase [Thiobacillus sp.]